MSNDRQLSIGFDLTGIWRPNTGILIYALRLAQHLVRYDTNNRYTLFFSRDVHPGFRDLEGKFKSIVLPSQGEVLTKQFLMSIVCNRAHLDLIHFPALPPPAACFRRFIWTLHDAAPWLYPETLDLKGRLYFRQLGALAARRSRALITVSHDSKRRITEALPIPADKVFVTHCGVGEEFRKVNDDTLLQSVRTRYRLPERFILTVGTLEPRKNLPFLLEAYCRFVALTRTDLGLVIAGRSGWKLGSLKSAWNGPAQQVVLTGFVPQDDLVALYSLADALILPSIYEGFGLPPLEAMACGCPVIVSSSGSLPEVVGDAALFIDPEDPDSLVAVMSRLEANRSLRAELTRRGLERAKQFTWRYAAEKTLHVYREVANS